MRETWLEQERNWLNLAQSYEFADRLTAFLKSVKRARAEVPAAPDLQPHIGELMCANCSGAMRLVLIEPGQPRFHQCLFECEACHRTEHVEVKLE